MEHDSFKLLFVFFIVVFLLVKRKLVLMCVNMKKLALILVMMSLINVSNLFQFETLVRSTLLADTLDIVLQAGGKFKIKITS